MNQARPLYALRKLDGSLVGPVTMTRVQELLHQGHISPQASLAVVGKPFRSLWEYPELVGLLQEISGERTDDFSGSLPSIEPGFAGGDPYGELEPMRVVFDDEDTRPAEAEPSHSGQLGDVPVPRLFYGIHVGGYTGRLVLVEGESQRQLFFQRGKPLMLSSISNPEDLIQRLEARRLGDPVQLRELLQRATRPGSSFLGNHLIASGLVDPFSLCEVYAEQLTAFLVDSFFFMKGYYLFFVDEKPAESPIPLEADLLAIIKQGIWSVYRSKRLLWYLEPYFNCIASLSDIMEQTLLAALKLTPPEARLVNQARRQQSTLWNLIHDVEQAGLMSSEDAQRLVFFLAEIELLLLDGQILGYGFESESKLLAGA